MNLKNFFYADGIIPACIPALNEAGKPYKKWDGATLGGNVGLKFPCDEDGSTVYGEDTGGYCLKLTANQVCEIYWSWRTYKISCDVQATVEASADAYGVTATALAPQIVESDIFADGWLGGVVVPARGSIASHVYEKPLEVVCGPLPGGYYGSVFSSFQEVDGADGDPVAPNYPVIDDATYFVPDGGNILFDGYIDYLKQCVFGTGAAMREERKSKYTEVSETVTSYGQAGASSSYGISVGGIGQVTGIPISKDFDYEGIPIHRPYILGTTRKSSAPFGLIQVTNPETGVIEYWLKPGDVFSCGVLASALSTGSDGEGNSGYNETVLGVSYRTGWFEADSTVTDEGLGITLITQSVDPVEFTLIFKDQTQVSVSIPMGKSLYLRQTIGSPPGWTGTTGASASENVICSSVTIEPVDFIEWDS